MNNKVVRYLSQQTTFGYICFLLTSIALII